MIDTVKRWFLWRAFMRWRRRFGGGDALRGMSVGRDGSNWVSCSSLRYGAECAHTDLITDGIPVNLSPVGDPAATTELASLIAKVPMRKKDSSYAGVDEYIYSMF